MLNPLVSSDELPRASGDASAWISTSFQPGLVSVVIPTYNRAELLGETIHSILRQTYRPIEIVVVDDGSRDCTHELISVFVAQARPQLTIRYFYQTNAGAPAARNRGTRECSGEFIQYLDSDDLLENTKVELQVAALRSNNAAGFAYGPIRELENPSRTIYCQNEMSWERLVRKSAVVPAMQTAGPLCRRSMIAGLGPWNESIAPFDDWEYFSRAAVQGVEGVYAPGSVTYHRMQVAERLRLNGNPGTIDRYLDGRVAQLESMIAHASNRTLSMLGFHDLIAQNLLFAGAFAVANGWVGNERQLYHRARSVARGRAVKSAAYLSQMLSRHTTRSMVAKTLLAGRWIYYHTIFKLVGWGA